MAVTGRAKEYYAKSLDFTANANRRSVSFHSASRVTSCVCLLTFPRKRMPFFEMAVQTSLLQDIWIKPNEAAQMAFVLYLPSN